MHQQSLHMLLHPLKHACFMQVHSTGVLSVRQTQAPERPCSALSPPQCYGLHYYKPQLLDLHRILKEPWSIADCHSP